MEGFSRSALQREKVANQILYSLRNRQGQSEPRTWKELLKLTGLSKATLFKYLPMLIKEGYVKGEARVPEDRIEHVYFLAHSDLGGYVIHEESVIGKKSTEAIRIHVPKDPSKIRTFKAYAEPGVMRRSSNKVAKDSNKMVFRRTDIKPPLANTKPKKQLRKDNWTLALGCFQTKDDSFTMSDKA